MSGIESELNAAEKSAEAETLAGGRWSSPDEDYSEQLRAAEYIDEHFEFSTSYQYTPSRFTPPNKLPVATVRGFWLRETERELIPEHDMEFCVLLELEDGEMCTVSFTVGEPDSSGAQYMEWLFKTLGVGSDSAFDILGRKAYYARLDATHETDAELKLFNTYLTYRSIATQPVGMVVGGLGLILGFAALAYPMLMWGLWACFFIGLVLMALPFARDRFDRSAISVVKQYQIEE